MDTLEYNIWFNENIRMCRIPRPPVEGKYRVWVETIVGNYLGMGYTWVWGIHLGYGYRGYLWGNVVITKISNMW
jgi:hypothetical protein